MPVIKTSPKKTIKKPKRSLTPRQKKVVEIMVDNGSNTKKEIVKKAGYSPAIQKVPSKVFESKGIRDALITAGITDEFLVRKHKQHLDAKKIETKDYYDWDHEEYNNNAKEIEEEIQEDLESRFPGAKLIRVSTQKKGRDNEFLCARYTIPDYSVQDKSLDKAYKIHGSYAPDKHEHSGDFSLLDLFRKPTK